MGQGRVVGGGMETTVLEQQRTKTNRQTKNQTAEEAAPEHESVEQTQIPGLSEQDLVTSIQFPFSTLQVGTLRPRQCGW